MSSDLWLSNHEVAELYRRYGFSMRRRCQLLLRNPQAAEDALQEAFIKIMRHGSVTREMQRPLTWLYRVTDRCCFDIMRSRQYRRRDETPLAPDQDPVGPHPSVSFEVRNAVLRILAGLNEKEQMLAVLAFVDGMSQEEIAQEIGWSRPTVHKKLQAIRERALRMTGVPHA